MTKKAKILCIIIPICLLIICATSTLFVLNNSKRKVENEVKNQINNILTNIESEINAFNSSHFSTLIAATTIPEIKSPELSLKEKCEIFYGIKSKDPSILGINILDLRGNSYLIEGFYENFSERPYFTEALKGKETIFGPIKNKVSYIPTIFYGAPFYNDDGDITNTVFLAAKADFLSEICAKHTENTNYHAIIMRRSTGLVIADKNPDYILKENIYDKAAETGIIELHDVMENIFEGKTSVDFLRGADKSRLVLAYAPIEQTDWAILVESRY